MSLYETFFEMEVDLVECFPGMTIFQIRRERAAEVFLLIRRLSNQAEKKKKKKNKKNVIRRPAGDNWF